jgi:hypothetical protein
VNAASLIGASDDAVKIALGELKVSGGAARIHLGNALGEGIGDAHHLIPWSTRNHPLVLKAAQGGFNINGAENGVRLLDHAYGGHLGYIKDVRGMLDAYQSLNPGLNPDQAAHLLRTVAGSLRDHLRAANLPLR